MSDDCDRFLTKTRTELEECNTKFKSLKPKLQEQGLKRKKWTQLEAHMCQDDVAQLPAQMADLNKYLEGYGSLQRDMGQRLQILMRVGDQLPCEAHKLQEIAECLFINVTSLNSTLRTI